MGVFPVDLVDGATLVILFWVNMVYVSDWLVSLNSFGFLVVVRWEDFSECVPHFQLAIECGAECISKIWL